MGADLHEQAGLSASTVADDDEFATEFGHRARRGRAGVGAE
jgi:hypothetical protein